MALLVTWLLAGALAAATAGARLGLVGAVLLTQVVLVIGWLMAARVRAAIGVGAVALLAAVGCDLAILFSHDHTTLGPVAGILGCTVLAAMAVQLGRRGGRGDLVPSLAATVAAATCAVAVTAYLPTRSLNSGRDLVLTGLAAIAAAALPFLLPGPVWLRAILGFVFGSAAAIAVGTAALTASQGAALGVAAAGLTVAVRAGLQGLPPGARFGRAALEGALPLAVAAPAVYVIGRVLVS